MYHRQTRAELEERLESLCKQLDDYPRCIPIGNAINEVIEKLHELEDEEDD